MVWRLKKKKKKKKQLVIKPPYDPAIPLLGTYPEETKCKKTHVQKHMYPSVHCSTIYNI